MSAIDRIESALRDAYTALSTQDLAEAAGCRPNYAWAALRKLERQGLALCVNDGERGFHEPLMWVAS